MNYLQSTIQQFGEFARVKIENTTESDENIEVPVKEETKQKEPSAIWNFYNDMKKCGIEAENVGKQRNP